jgi:hypothetical protein
MVGCVGCGLSLLSIGTGWVATNRVPVFVSTGPKLNDEFLHARELNVCVPGSSVEFVAFGIFVSVVVPDERQILQRTQMEGVLPAGRVGVCVGRPSMTTFSTSPASTWV